MAVNGTPTLLAGTPQDTYENAFLAPQKTPNSQKNPAPPAPDSVNPNSVCFVRPARRPAGRPAGRPTGGPAGWLGQI